EYGAGGNLLELLKEIAPSVTRAAVLRDSANPAGIAQFGAIQTAGESRGVAVTPIDVQDADEIERAVASFARSPNGGLIVTPSGSVSIHRDLIVALAARHKLPAIYAYRFNVTAGGLISYGPDLDDQYRGPAGYVHPILKERKPGAPPEQGPAKL